MKLRRGLYLSLPLALAAGCLLPSFETDASLDGSGGSGGSGGTGAIGGDAGSPANQGGSGDGGAAGAAGGATTAITVNDDELVTAQETELEDNVLGNDDEGLSVIGVEDLETALAAEYQATFELAPDGTLTFEPAPGFFGPYRLRYEVENTSGETASATVTIVVQPVNVELAAVAADVGGFCLTGPANERVGSAVSAAGDLDGDGFGDLLIGAPGAGTDAGALYVVRGSAAPRSFGLVPLGNDDQEERYFVLTGEADSELGAAVAPIGDLVGDSVDDFLVGAPGGPIGDGKVYVVPGSSAWQGSEAIGTTTPVVFSGGASDNAGRILAAGFDLNGDAAQDPVVVVKLPPGNDGRYYLLDGGELQSGALVDEGLDYVDGSSTNDNLTRAAAHVGDVDDDDENDLLLASAKVIALLRGPASNFPANLASGSFAGDEGVWLDRASDPDEPISLTAAGDFDGDGVRDLAYCEGTEDCLVVFGPVTDLSSGLVVTNLGGPAWISGGVDLAGPFGSASDGAAELVVAQRDASADSDADQIFVLFGGAGQKTGSLSATGLGDQGFTVTAAAGSDLAALAPVGDVNGDGWADFAVGDVGNEQVCVVFGGPYLR